jgi:hypothetical protein
MTYYLSILRVHQVHAEQDAPNKGHHQWRRQSKSCGAAAIASRMIPTMV